MSSEEDVEPVIAAWCQAVHHAWSAARGERLALLRGSHMKRFDSRGLHTWSVEVGRVLALQELVPELSYAGFDPLLLRRDAEAAAVEALRDEIREELRT